jgi:uncharacterized protein (TIGR02231 family)
MTSLSLTAASLAFTSHLCFQGPAPAPAISTTIRDVTVYPTQALVTRVGNVAVQRGVNRVELRGLPAGLRDDSVRVKASGGSNVVGVDVLPLAAPEAPSAAVEDLRKQRQQKQREREALADQAEILKSQRAYLDSIRAEAPKIFGQASLNGAVDPSKWKDAVEFLTQALTHNVDASRKLATDDVKVAAELAALDQRLQQLQSGTLVPTKTIALDLLANDAATAEVELSYLVGNAGWRPSYDLRATETLKSAALLLFAVVTQRTGEDWTDVNLTFSTAKPERGAEIPKPDPMILTVFVPRPSGEARLFGAASGEEEFARRDSLKKMRADAKSAGDDLHDAEKAGMPAPASPLPVDAEVASSGLATQLRVPRAETVPADNRPHRVRAAEVPLELTPVHVTVPKAATRAFVQAKPVPKAAFPILAGQAQVFVGNDFVGKIALADTPIGEKLELSLGADPGLTIERRQEKADRQGPGFLGSRATWTFRYRITVKNASAATGAATVEIVETIPVSRDDRVKVDVESSEPAFERGEKEDRERETQGILRWKLPVARGEERAIVVTYTVTAPEDLTIAGLDVK